MSNRINRDDFQRLSSQESLHPPQRNKDFAHFDVHRVEMGTPLTRAFGASYKSNQLRNHMINAIQKDDPKAVRSLLQYSDKRLNKSRFFDFGLMALGPNILLTPFVPHASKSMFRDLKTRRLAFEYLEARGGLAKQLQTSVMPGGAEGNTEQMQDREQSGDGSDSTGRVD